jgi:hypothetical protein
MTDHEKFKKEVLDDVDEMFKQADRRHDERDVILGDWLCDDITSDECTERLKNIKFYE